MKNYKYLPSSNQPNVELSPLHWISRIHFKYTQEIDDILKRYQLDASRHWLMHAIYNAPNASISQLAEILAYRMSTTTKLVQRLKEQSFVETHPCSEDARITRVKLTQQGQDKVIRMNELLEVKLSNTFEGLTASQIEKLAQQLKRLFQNLTR
ncbi:MarR family winged helix-turn-helix transcriptional regulator [Acinetobacter sp. MD2]|uniref:MarR family winged helix-turn-helix transcriptional regulator n=1 Tax=Acinetobacter sp. MD2 TaxID=2600066 RepID=UPI002D1ED615|nr:MarR family winged helix-turn-helix transcriptional regulator [Acinetobacter sp. MD2]MEB3766576.1 winged helix-turn-helix transcriptional regulator [Acinetobacter sp. MD2]